MEQGNVEIPEEAYAAAYRATFATTGECTAILKAAAPFIVAAELERISLQFDEVAIAYDRLNDDPERDRTLHLTGKAIGYERAARDLRLHASLLRGDE
jgi:hypothetical protein